MIRFSVLFHKQDNFCDFLFTFLNSKAPSEKGVYSLGANAFILD